MISIIIPVYNAGSYLRRCLESIIAQNYADIQIVIVDDGSLDNSLKICRYFEANYDNVIVIAQQNAGVSAARNAGLGVAKGEYVMFVDSDDYMFPQMCETMVHKIEEKGADLVVCGTTETWGGVWAPKRDVDYSSLESFKSDFIEHLTSELLSPPWNKIYRREQIKDLFDTSSSFGEDLMFNLNYLKSCQRISFIKSAPFYHEKANEESLVNRVYPSRLIEIEKVHSAVLDFCNTKNPQIHQKYIRDLLVYVKAIIKNEKYSREELFIYLNEWIKTSYLNNLEPKQLSISWKNKLLLRCLKKRRWNIAYAIINFKSLISLKR